MAKQEKQEQEEQVLEATGFTEAPASINVKFLWQGFDTMLTIRDEKVNAALAKYRVAIEYLEKIGATPTPARNYGNHVGRVQQAGNDGNGNGKSKYCSHKSDEPGFCPTHGKELKKSKHHPGYYCPTKV